jgi:predicted RNase H-like nuclease (RuvC/YqgF family)
VLLGIHPSRHVTIQVAGRDGAREIHHSGPPSARNDGVASTPLREQLRGALGTIERLQAENETLRAEIDVARSENEALRAENVVVRCTNPAPPTSTDRGT